MESNDSLKSEVALDEGSKHIEKWIKIRARMKELAQSINSLQRLEKEQGTLVAGISAEMNSISREIGSLKNKLSALMSESGSKKRAEWQNKLQRLDLQLTEEWPKHAVLYSALVEAQAKLSEEIENYNKTLLQIQSLAANDN